VLGKQREVLHTAGPNCRLQLLIYGELRKLCAKVYVAGKEYQTSNNTEGEVLKKGYLSLQSKRNLMTLSDVTPLVTWRGCLRWAVLLLVRVLLWRPSLTVDDDLETSEE
jgi:hypothetical protein